MPPRRKAAPPTEAEALASDLANYDGDYLDCRNLGHVWASRGFFRWGNGVRRLLDCQRCGNQRTDTWSSQGERLGAAYTYPEDYKVGWPRTATRADVRIEIVRRAVIYNTQEELLADLTTGRR
jgi:hypothetical protein